MWKNDSPDDAAKANVASLHGETAARRQAITELLFFASVGDLARCTRVCASWNLDPSDPAVCDYDLRTPLHLAASEGCYSVASWLLESKANVNAVDRFKHTPLEDAVRGDHGEVVNLLLAAGGKLVGRHDGALVELADTPLSGNVRIFGELDPEWEVDPQQLRLMDKIGEGEFGVVYKAKYYGTTVAVKILKNRDSVALGDFRTELNVLQKVHHPHCVQFIGAVTKSQPFMIMTEYMACGSLADILRAHELPYLRRAVQLALEMARGIAYLHNHHPLNIIHRDLKPANLMIGGTPDIGSDLQHKLLVYEVGVVKIADFGLSKSLKLVRPPLVEDSANTSLTNGGSMVSRPASSNSVIHGRLEPAKGYSHSYKMTGETGSYRYMAPEVFRHECYNHKVDQYSFAMIAYQLLEGSPPFKMCKPVQAARVASLGERPAWGTTPRGREVPGQLRALVERCWAADFEQRPEFTEIIAELEEVMQRLPVKPSAALLPDENGGVTGCCSVQ